MSRRVSPAEGYALATRFFSVLIIGFGVAILAVTLSRGGGPTAFGILIGVVFCGIGAGRLYLALRGSR
jgi:hypothetical protein